MISDTTFIPDAVIFEAVTDIGPSIKGVWVVLSKITCLSVELRWSIDLLYDREGRQTFSYCGRLKYSMIIYACFAR